MSVSLVSPFIDSVQPPAYLCGPSDPLPHWPHPHNRSAKDDCFFLPPAEVERDSSICRRHNLDIAQMASHWLLGGALWYICLVWRLFRDHWVLCRKYTCGRSVHTDGTREDIGRKKECRITCIRCKRREGTGNVIHDARELDRESNCRSYRVIV